MLPTKAWNPKDFRKNHKNSQKGLNYVRTSDFMPWNKPGLDIGFETKIYRAGEKKFEEIGSK